MGVIKTEETVACETRQCFITQDTVEILETSKTDDGGLRETYRFQLKRGSAGRAAMHGLLDVATLGVWEVAGTPIEATKQKKYIVITAVYNKHGRLISKELGSPLSVDEVEGATTGTTIPEGSTPVTANGKIVGYLTESGELIPTTATEETDIIEDNVDAGS